MTLDLLLGTALVFALAVSACAAVRAERHRIELPPGSDNSPVRAGNPGRPRAYTPEACAAGWEQRAPSRKHSSMVQIERPAPPAQWLERHHRTMSVVLAVLTAAAALTAGSLIVHTWRSAVVAAYGAAAWGFIRGAVRLAAWRATAVRPAEAAPCTRPSPLNSATTKDS
ncbi:hypothetical protein [Kitasatospora sp. HPMI-4]|uniref:hypothetical protein n=1 Tax=Kitasatospora sp. HPMI-4 TaxID=3448443 RepID=UPI003F1B82B7